MRLHYAYCRVFKFLYPLVRIIFFAVASRFFTEHKTYHVFLSTSLKRKQEATQGHEHGTQRKNNFFTIFLLFKFGAMYYSENCFFCLFLIFHFHIKKKATKIFLLVPHGTELCFAIKIKQVAFVFLPWERFVVNLQV